MFAYYLHDLSPFLFEFREGMGLRWYGLAYVMAFLCGYWLYRSLSRRGLAEIPPDKVGDFITWGAVFGVLVGGRVGYILFYDFGAFLQNPLLLFKVWDGGMSSHGGMIGLILFTLYYARRHHYSWTGIGDNLCVVAPVGLFFGRVANFINGELYGRATQVSWAMQFPAEMYEQPAIAREAIVRTEALGVPARSVGEVIAAASADPQVEAILRGVLTPRHPSQIYQALLEGVLLFAVLWLMRTRMRVPRGVLTGTFFLVYAVLRILGEMFREPDQWTIGPVTAGQLLSVLLIAIGAVFVGWGMRTRHYEKALQRR
jgi:phosphatidylglycerol:prolipoprotein diacylglycerol transferase